MFKFVRQTGVACAIVMLIASAGCQTLNKKEQGAIIGAAVGGAAGAIIGHQMDQKAKEIQAKVPGAVVTREGEGLVVTFESGLLFDFDSDQLRQASRQNLDNLAASLSTFGDSKLLLVGHTDDKGTDT